MSSPEPYSAEELVTLRTGSSYQTRANARWFATLAAVARPRDAEVRELVHMRSCASCAEGDWGDCPHGLHALGLLAKASGTPPASPVAHARETGGEAVPGGGGVPGGAAAP